MRSKDMKLGEEELVLKTNIKKENPWLYFLDKDGDISRGKMGALISVNPARYAKPEKVKRFSGSQGRKPHWRLRDEQYRPTLPSSASSTVYIQRALRNGYHSIQGDGTW